MSKLIRVGAAQIEPKLGDLEANRKKIKSFIEKAAKLSIDLLVFPELANSGYNFASREEAEKCAEKIEDSRTIKLVEDLSSEFNMYVVLGFNEKGEDGLYNSAVLISPDKGVLGVYRKVHLFYREKEIYTPGNSFYVFDTKIGKIGIMICFDWIFPEATRTLALKGAEIICHPANLVLPYCPKVMPWRALENRVFTITANRIGEEKDLRFIGMSVICSPKAEYLAIASPNLEEIVFADINPSLARDKKITPLNDIFQDRRSDVYFS